MGRRDQSPDLLLALTSETYIILCIFFNWIINFNMNELIVRKFVHNIIIYYEQTYVQRGGQIAHTKNINLVLIHF